MYVKLNSQPLWFSILEYFEKKIDYFQIPDSTSFPKIVLDKSLRFFDFNSNWNSEKYKDYFEILKFRDLKIDSLIFYFLLEIFIKLGLITIIDLHLIRNIYQVKKAVSKHEEVSLWTNIIDSLNLTNYEKNFILINVIELYVEISYMMLQVENNNLEYIQVLEKRIEEKFGESKDSVVPQKFKFNILVLGRLLKSSLLTLYNFVNFIFERKEFIPKCNSVIFEKLNINYINLTWNSEKIKTINFNYRKSKKKKFNFCPKLELIKEIES
ncbi:hypothetical protein [Carp edema virus]|nr:hypothetical protein [Carp edema virus]